MGLENFIPQIWSARLMANLRVQLIFAQPQISNREYEGEITDYGQSVKINSVGTVTTGDYTKNTDFQSGPQLLDDASAVLTIDAAKYFNFYIDDVDKAQTRPKVMDAAMAEAAYALQVDVDSYIATKMVTEAAVGQNRLGSDGSPLTVGTGAGDRNAYEQLVDISVAMDNALVPADGRYCVVPPWFHGYLLKDYRFTSYGTPDNTQRLANGLIGRAAGMDIFKSTVIPLGAGNTVSRVIAGHPMSFTFAVQVNDVQAYRPEKRFGDAVKGLTLFGGKAIRPNALVIGHFAKGS